MTFLKEAYKKSHSLVIYATSMACMVFLLKWLQWKFLITDHSIEIYIGLIALLFTGLGTWIAIQLVRFRTNTIVVEKEVYIAPEEDFVLNVEALEDLNLSNREYEVLEQIVLGYSNATISKNLFLSLSTVKTHASNLYVKMEVKSRTQAIEKAKRLKITP